MANSVVIKIKRQDTPNGKAYWDEFELPYKPGRNVISALMEIAANPVTRRRQEDYAHYVRLELPGRGLRLVRHADQREGPHGLFCPAR